MEDRQFASTPQYPPGEKGVGIASGAALRTARVLSRVLTWGMPERERQDQIAESDVYWESMAIEYGARRVILQAIRAIPLWLWTRLSARDTTTLPAALGIALIGVGGITAMLQPGAYSETTRTLMAVATTGLLLAAYTLVRTPRRLILRRLGIPASLAAFGILGIAVDMPNPTVWEYGTPILSSPLIDALTMTGLLVVGVGAAVVAVGALFRSRHVAGLGGVLIIAGLSALGLSQVLWGIWDTSVDLALASASIVTGLAALSLVHVSPRLRHLEIE
jgi:hypothetical protein